MLKAKVRYIVILAKGGRWLGVRGLEFGGWDWNLSLPAAGRLRIPFLQHPPSYYPDFISTKDCYLIGLEEVGNYVEKLTNLILFSKIHSKI